MKLLFQRRHSNAQLALFSLTLLETTRAGMNADISTMFAIWIVYGIVNVFVVMMENYAERDR